MKKLNRRTFLQCTSAALITPLLHVANGQEADKQLPLLQKLIPTSGERLTVIGMGTWQTFNVGSDNQLRANRTEILDLFFQLGGEMVDSSPMYGSSQQMLGHGLSKLNYPKNLFSAEKVWTSNKSATSRQIQETADAWRVNQFDLMQVHNLVSWREHLAVLKEMRANGQLRYVGVTTSHGRRHDELENVLKTEPLDFVQLTYSLANRDVEERLLPIAQDRGIAVIANRPFQGGYLVDQMQSSNEPLPDFAKDIQCENWPQFLLKYVVSHPAVTCAIPATTQLEHMRENMGAAQGVLPDEKMRKEMYAYVTSL